MVLLVQQYQLMLVYPTDQIKSKSMSNKFVDFHTLLSKEKQNSHSDVKEEMGQVILLSTYLKKI